MSFRNVLWLTLAISFLVMMLPLESWFPGTGFYHFIAQGGHSLSEAIFIAAFLALTVDLYVKRNLAEQVVKDVSPFIASASLPGELQEEIREISTIDLYRSSLILDYEIITIPENQDFVGVVGKVEFVLCNVSNDPVPYRHAIAVTKPYQPAAPIEQILSTWSTGAVTKKKKSLEYEIEPEKKGETYDEGTQKAWHKDCYILGKGSAEFGSKTYQILPSEYEETFVSVIASTSITIKVRYPGDISVNVIFGHRHRDTVKERPSGRAETWTFKGGILPYQPVMIAWRKKPTPISDVLAEQKERLKGGGPTQKSSEGAAGSEAGKTKHKRPAESGHPEKTSAPQKRGAQNRVGERSSRKSP